MTSLRNRLADLVRGRPPPVPPRAFARLGARSVVAEPMLGVVNPAGIEIGEDVYVSEHAFLDTHGPPGEVVLRIGDRTYIGFFARISAVTEVTLGRSVLIADRVYIADTSHVYDDPDVPIRDQGLRTGRRVVIEDGAWLGIGASVIGNVRVGRNAVVGAGAVVREDVPDRAVVIGNPARVVRRWVDGRWEWTG